MIVNDKVTNSPIRRRIMTRQALRFCLATLAPALLIGLAAPAHTADPADERPIRALLVIGGGSHDYGKQKDIVVAGISARANVAWKVAYDPITSNMHANAVYADPNWAAGFDVIVHDESCGRVTDLALVRRILEPHRAGLPAVMLHSAMHCFRTEGWPKAVTPWFECTGLQTTGHGPQFPISIHFTDASSPITAGLQDWTTIQEELYNNAAGKLLDTAHLLARGKQTVKIGAAKKKNAEPGGKEKKDIETKEKTEVNVVAWTNLYNGKTRVFATTVGHNNETVADPRYLDLITRGLLWSVDKLDAAHLKPAKKMLLDD
jgi:type 1 glutamine amidotransferase